MGGVVGVPRQLHGGLRVETRARCPVYVGAPEAVKVDGPGVRRLLEQLPLSGGQLPNGNPLPMNVRASVLPSDGDGLPGIDPERQSERLPQSFGVAEPAFPARSPFRTRKDRARGWLLAVASHALRMSASDSGSSKCSAWMPCPGSSAAPPGSSATPSAPHANRARAGPSYEPRRGSATQPP